MYSIKVWKMTFFQMEVASIHKDWSEGLASPESSSLQNLEAADAELPLSIRLREIRTAKKSPMEMPMHALG